MTRFYKVSAIWFVFAVLAILLAAYGELIGSIISGVIAAVLLETLTPRPKGGLTNAQSDSPRLRAAEKSIWIGSLQFVDEISRVPGNHDIHFEPYLGQVFLMGVARLYKSGSLSAEVATKASRIVFDWNHGSDTELLDYLRSLFTLELYHDEHLDVHRSSWMMKG